MEQQTIINILWSISLFLGGCIGILLNFLSNKNDTISELRKKNKNTFMKLNNYILNPNNISFIRYDDNNDVARIYFTNHDDWIEVDIDPHHNTKADFINSLNNATDFVIDEFK